MADQSSEGERDVPEVSPCIARATSIRTRTRPISKIIARSFGAGMSYLTLRLNTTGLKGVPGVPLERSTPMMAGRMEMTATTAIT